MAQYGDIDYWNKRYSKEEDNPFDWLFDFNDLNDIISKLIPNKNDFILLPGCGNASFSPDLFHIGGYKNLENIDTSEVAIHQMKSKYPEIIWKVMDVLNLEYQNNSVKNIIDKSLIDTLMCYKDGTTTTKKMIENLYKILSPGGTYITFSLHSVSECEPFFNDPKFRWKYFLYRVKSSRWNDTDNRRRAVACTMIVCFKAIEDGSYDFVLPNDMKGVLSEEEYLKLERISEEVNLKAALKKASVQDLMNCLNVSLVSYITLYKSKELQ